MGIDVCVYTCVTMSRRGCVCVCACYSSVLCVVCSLPCVLSMTLMFNFLCVLFPMF